MTDPSVDLPPSRRAEAISTGRASAVAAAIRRRRLIIVLRRVAPRTRLLELVDELVSVGGRVFEVTLDGSDATGDLAAVADFLGRVPHDADGRSWVGAGTVRTIEGLRAAHQAGAAFGVSPVLDREVLDAALALGLPFMPGAMSPTEIDAAWRAGAVLVKVFPGSSVGPTHVRELRGPLDEIELVVTGGVDLGNAAAFLEAGATAVGIGSAILRATSRERAALIAAITSTTQGGASATAPDPGP